MPAARAHTTVTRKASPTRACNVSREQLFSHTLTNQHPHSAITRLAPDTRVYCRLSNDSRWRGTCYYITRVQPTYGCITTSDRVVVVATICARHADPALLPGACHFLVSQLASYVFFLARVGPIRVNQQHKYSYRATPTTTRTTRTTRTKPSVITTTEA